MIKKIENENSEIGQSLNVKTRFLKIMLFRKRIGKKTFSKDLLCAWCFWSWVCV